MGMKPYYFSVLVDKVWMNRLKALAYRKGIPASELIRRVMESYMKQESKKSVLTRYGQSETVKEDENGKKG